VKARGFAIAETNKWKELLLKIANKLSEYTSSKDPNSLIPTIEMEYVGFNLTLQNFPKKVLKRIQIALHPEEAK